MAEDQDKKLKRRRDVLKIAGRGAAVLAAGSLAAAAKSAGGDELVWQLDPQKCIQCSRCATECVLTLSAVKCVHAFSMCGYCELCFGYFLPTARERNEAAENQACPTGAITRRFIEEPYFEYTIDEKLCIGCAKCVKGCSTFGNGSLFLQVRHDRCLNCNECSIAKTCPSKAYSRVKASAPYLLKGVSRDRRRKNGSR